MLKISMAIQSICLTGMFICGLAAENANLTLVIVAAVILIIFLIARAIEQSIEDEAYERKIANDIKRHNRTFK